MLYAVLFYDSKYTRSEFDLKIFSTKEKRTDFIEKQKVRYDHPTCKYWNIGFNTESFDLDVDDYSCDEWVDPSNDPYLNRV